MIFFLFFLVLFCGLSVILILRYLRFQFLPALPGFAGSAAPVLKGRSQSLRGGLCGFFAGFAAPVFKGSLLRLELPALNYLMTNNLITSKGFTRQTRKTR